MAARCSMCFLRAFTVQNLKLLSPSIRISRFSSQITFSKPTRNLSVTLSRHFSLSRDLQSSLKKDFSSGFVGKSQTSGSVSEPVASLGNHGQESSDEQKKKEEYFRKRAMKYTFIAFGAMFTGMACLIVYEWGSPSYDENGNLIIDEFTHLPKLKGHLLRTYREMLFYNKMIREPSRDRLLPDPLTEPYFQPPYTLVLEMTGVLVHPDWTYKTGWRFKKRPGVDYFLQQVGPPLFEVVIYTAEQGFTAYPIIDTLDPNGYIMYRLFRDATRYENGHHVKDLSCLNRDLSKVIFIDWDSKSFARQPGNALMVKKWGGNDDDRTLYELASLLRTIATSEIQDVRSVLEYYSQFDDPVSVYKENQRKIHEDEQKRLKESIGGPSTLAGSWATNLRGRR